MNPKLALGALTGLLLLAGCLPSLNAVYTEDNLIMDPTVVGVWTQPGSNATWELSQRDARSYTLVYTNDNGHPARFVAHLANVEGTQFLDLYPETMETDANGFYQLHVVPIHTIYLVRQTEPELQLASIDYDWFAKHLENHPDAIQHATFNGRKLITAPTAEVQSFVVKHKDAFRADFALQRRAAGVN
jgi:hypothetical protein